MLGHKDIDTTMQIYVDASENLVSHLVLNGDYIDDYEVDINDYSFITEYADETGFEYLIHQNPCLFKNKIPWFLSTICLTLAWEKKSISEDYQRVVETTVW